jgi:hypothetical protein
MKLNARKTTTAVGRTLALVALARKIGLRRGRRLAALAADAYLARQAFKHRAARQRG